MASNKQESPSKESIAVSVLLEFLPRFLSDDHILLVENYSEELQKTLHEKAISFSTWNRHWSKESEPSLWPSPTVQISAAIIRLPKSHEAFDMTLHAVSSALKTNDMIIVYGMNNEGIKGAQKKLQAFFGNCEVIGYKQRCRILSVKNTPIEIPSANLEDFKHAHTLTYSQPSQSKKFSFPFIFYPGMFATSTIDDGTKFLLDTVISRIEDGNHVLDYGCGSGIIARIVNEAYPKTEINLLDRDIISLSAAGENFPHYSNTINADSLAGCKKMKYDLIISNPPIHTEKEEHYRILHQLIADAPAYLKESGKLIIVAQSRIDLEEEFRHAKLTQTILAEDTRFKVWQGKKI